MNSDKLRLRCLELALLNAEGEDLETVKNRARAFVDFATEQPAIPAPQPLKVDIYDITGAVDRRWLADRITLLQTTFIASPEPRTYIDALRDVLSLLNPKML